METISTQKAISAPQVVPCPGLDTGGSSMQNTLFEVKNGIRESLLKNFSGVMDIFNAYQYETQESAERKLPVEKRSSSLEHVYPHLEPIRGFCSNE